MEFAGNQYRSKPCGEAYSIKLFLSYCCPLTMAHDDWYSGGAALLFQSIVGKSKWLHFYRRHANYYCQCINISLQASTNSYMQNVWNSGFSTSIEEFIKCRLCAEEKKDFTNLVCQSEKSGNTYFFRFWYLRYGDIPPWSMKVKAGITQRKNMILNSPPPPRVNTGDASDLMQHF